MKPREQGEAALSVQTAADLTDLAVVHYDEAAPNHPGRWQVSLALPGVKLPWSAGWETVNEGIGREDALLPRLSGLELLDCELVRALWLVAPVRIDLCLPAPSKPSFPGVKLTVGALGDPAILTGLSAQRGEWVASRGGEITIKERASPLAREPLRSSIS